MVEVASIGNFDAKILSAANAVAPILGAAMAWLGPPMADGRNLEGTPQYLIDALKSFKIANPVFTTQEALKLPNQFPIVSGITSAIIGVITEIAGESLDVPIIKSMGSAMVKFGSSATLNSLVSAWIYLARYNPHGAEGGPSSGAGGAYTTPPARSANTIDVDNPQGMAPLYSGMTPDYR